MSPSYSQALGELQALEDPRGDALLQNGPLALGAVLRVLVGDAAPLQRELPHDRRGLLYEGRRGVHVHARAAHGAVGQQDEVVLAGLETGPLLGALFGLVGLRRLDELPVLLLVGDVGADQEHAVVREHGRGLVAPLQDQRVRDEHDGPPNPPLLPRGADGRERGEGLADADIVDEDPAAVGEQAPHARALVVEELPLRIGGPAGDADRLVAVRGQHEAAGDAVERLEQGPLPLGRPGDPVAEVAAPHGDLLVAGLVEALQLLALGAEVHLVVVEPAEKIDGQRRELRARVEVGVVDAADLDQAARADQFDLGVAAVDGVVQPAGDQRQRHPALAHRVLAEVMEERRADRRQQAPHLLLRLRIVRVRDGPVVARPQIAAVVVRAGQ
jgi:hypothetical protein